MAVQQATEEAPLSSWLPLNVIHSIGLAQLQLLSLKLERFVRMNRVGTEALTTPFFFFFFFCLIQQPINTLLVAEGQERQQDMHLGQATKKKKDGIPPDNFRRVLGTALQTGG